LNYTINTSLNPTISKLASDCKILKLEREKKPCTLIRQQNMQNARLHITERNKYLT